MLSGISPTRNFRTCLVKTGIPHSKSFIAAGRLLIEEEKAVACRTDKVARTALDACRGEILP